MPRFVVQVQVDEIAAAHFLPQYIGPCANMHGHHWSFEAQVGADALCDDMVIDFVEIKAIFKELDHCLLNDIPDLISGGHRPTAERLAEWLANKVQHALDSHPNHPRLLSLSVMETSRNRITYTPDARRA